MEYLPKKQNISSRKDIEKIKVTGQRPESLSYENEGLLKKEYLEKNTEIINFGINAVKEYLDGLGINHKNDFNFDRISDRLETPSFVGGTYFHDIDMVTMNDRQEHIKPHALVHELLHANSSLYRQENYKKIEGYIRENKKSVKSGFHIAHYKNGKENEATSVNFTRLNEAVTEKIARDIVKINKPGIVDLNKKEIENILLEKQNFELENTQQPIASEEVSIFDIPYDIDKLNELSGEIESESYQGEIDALDLIMEGIALSNVENFSDLEKYKSDFWIDLQKAYFTGNTMFLRNIEKVYGEGSLRRIDENLNSFQSGLLDDLREKNNRLRNELLEK